MSLPLSATASVAALCATVSTPSSFNGCVLDTTLSSSVGHYITSYINEAQAVTDSLKKEFQALAHQWKTETQMDSMTHLIVMHPAYQRIISFGKRALPLIFDEMKNQPGHWMWALAAITGVNPAPENASLRETFNAWMEWGKEHGYA